MMTITLDDLRTLKDRLDACFDSDSEASSAQMLQLHHYLIRAVRTYLKQVPDQIHDVELRLGVSVTQLNGDFGYMMFMTDERLLSEAATKAESFFELEKVTRLARRNRLVHFCAFRWPEVWNQWLCRHIERPYLSQFHPQPFGTQHGANNERILRQRAEIAIQSHNVVQAKLLLAIRDADAGWFNTFGARILGELESVVRTYHISHPLSF